MSSFGAEPFNSELREYVSFFGIFPPRLICITWSSSTLRFSDYDVWYPFCNHLFISCSTIGFTRTHTHTHIKTQLKAIIAKISVEWNGEKKTKKKKKKWVGANTLLRIWSIVSLSRSLRNIAMHSVTVRLWSPISEWHDLCLNWIVSVLMSRYTMTRYSNGLTCNGICENEKRKKKLGTNWLNGVETF